MTDEEYRKHILVADQKAVEDFDKTLVTLSGGALAVSLTFLKDIVGDGPVHSIDLLRLAWLLLTLALACVLSSFWCSHRALRRTLYQLDTGEFEWNPKLRSGGGWTSATTRLNVFGMLMFIGGVATLLMFAALNLEKPHDGQGQGKDESQAATSGACGKSAADTTTPADAGWGGKGIPTTAEAPDKAGKEGVGRADSTAVRVDLGRQ